MTPPAAPATHILAVYNRDRRIEYAADNAVQKLAMRIQSRAVWRCERQANRRPRRRTRFAAYLYIRFQVPKDCKRSSLAVMSDTRITRIPLDPMALRGGYLAGRRGITDEANPYQAGAPAALAWRIGWVSGLKKQLRVMYGGRSVFTGRFRTRPFLSSQ